MAQAIGTKLKELKSRARLSTREVAERVGMPTSTYQKYEDRYRRSYLPLHLVAKLVQALGPEGIIADEIWEMAEPSQIEAFHEAWAARTDAPARVAAPTGMRQEPARQPGVAGRRRYDRWTPLAANLAHEGETHACIIRDISPAGACVLAEAAVKLREAADVLLELGGHGAVPARVARTQGNEIGLAFVDDASAEREMAAWLEPLRQVMQ